MLHSRNAPRRAIISHARVSRNFPVSHSRTRDPRSRTRARTGAHAYTRVSGGPIFRNLRKEDYSRKIPAMTVTVRRIDRSGALIASQTAVYRGLSIDRERRGAPNKGNRTTKQPLAIMSVSFNYSLPFNDPRCSFSFPLFLPLYRVSRAKRCQHASSFRGE